MQSIVDQLNAHGARTLTDEQLLALLLSSSNTDSAAIALARDILAEYSPAALVDTDLKRLRMIQGMGLRRAVMLKAAAELGRRVVIAQTAAKEYIVESDKDVVAIMEPLLGDLQHEECWALYLASSGKVLDKVRISQGGIQATVVDCRLILRRALDLFATQVVLVHNHPSGNVEPSTQDFALTERVHEACKIFDIRLLDHIIVARGDHFSFRGIGRLK